MTRPKADTDGWLTDPITRDRVIAEAVVRGLRNIEQTLRGIRDDVLAENRETRARYDDMALALARSEARLSLLMDVLESVPGLPSTIKDRMNSIKAPVRTAYYVEPCVHPACGLPSGHTDPHAPRRGRTR